MSVSLTTKTIITCDVQLSLKSLDIQGILLYGLNNLKSDNTSQFNVEIGSDDISI